MVCGKASLALFNLLVFHMSQGAKLPVRKWYKKISWIVNGLIIGAIIAGLVNRDFTTLLIGAGVGLAVAVVFKLVSWRRRRAEEKEWEGL